MKKCFIYVRVSTEEQAQEGKSIETQLRICRKWAQDNEYLVIEEFIDEGKSATSLNRPALKELLTRGKDEEIDAILVQDTDRLARNTLDHLTIKALLKKKNTQVISISQPMIDDSPEGNLIDTIIASVNAFQSQITGRKTSKVLEEKAKLGWFPGGTPPLGYKNIVNPAPTCSLDIQIIGIDELVALYILKAFEMYATGNYNVQGIVDFLNSKQIKSPLGYTIHVSYVARMLQNQFYLGKFTWNKVIYDKAKHPALIDLDIFMQVQKVLEAHNQNATRKRIHSFLLRGFLYCDNCSRKMWGEQHKKASGKIYEFYFCPTCKKDTYIDKELLEQQVAKLFKKIQISKDYVSHVLDTAKKILEEERTNQHSEKVRLYAEKSKLEKAIKETEDSRFITHTLTEESFMRIYPRYENQLKAINKEICDLDKDHAHAVEVLKKVLFLAEDAVYLLKRNYLNLFFKEFRIRNGKITKFALTDDLKPLIQDGSVRVNATGLAGWNDFRTQKWLDEIEYPEITTKQINLLLSL